MPNLKPTEAWAVVDKDGTLVDLDHIDSEAVAKSIATVAGFFARRVVIVDAETWERLKGEKCGSG